MVSFCCLEPRISYGGETVTGACGVLETALWKKDVGSILRFPGILAQGESNWGRAREKSQEGPGREQERGVREIAPGVVLGERWGVGVSLKIGLE